MQWKLNAVCTGAQQRHCIPSKLGRTCDDGESGNYFPVMRASQSKCALKIGCAAGRQAGLLISRNLGLHPWILGASEPLNHGSA